MGKLDDSFKIGDLPTDDDLFMIGEEDDDEQDESERNDPPEAYRAPRKKQSAKGKVAEDTPIPAATASSASTRGRWIVILVFCAGAAAMAFTTFSYISRNEKDEFENAVSIRTSWESHAVNSGSGTTDH